MAVFEYFDPEKPPELGAYLVGATKVKRQNLIGPGQVQDVINIQPVYLSSADAFKNFEKFSPQYRKSLSQLLKSAGYYRGEVTGEPTKSLRDSYYIALDLLSKENTERIRAFGPEGQQQIDDIETFLRRQARPKKGPKGPTTEIQEKEYTQQELNEIIQEVYRNELRRDASEEEIVKYSKRITKQASKPENMGRVIRTPTGEGTFKTQFKAGFNPQEFLVEKISGTDEAKANKLYGYYQVFDRFLRQG
jgi:hypothetical protein